MKSHTRKVRSANVLLAGAVLLALVGTSTSFGLAAAAGPPPPAGGVEPASPTRQPPPQAVQPQGVWFRTISPATATDIAEAIGVPGTDLLAADLMGSDPEGAGVGDAALGQWFPTEGSTFAILSTGLAADASLPNSEGYHSHKLDGLNNDRGEDLVRLHMQLKVPVYANCLAFDFAYYSEELPEWVGSEFNDTFTAQLNDSTLWTDESHQVHAPGNFAFDTQGDIISVNTVFGVSGSTGTTYDGVTPLLRASTAITPGATVDIYLSIQDLSDSLFDSAVFLDKFFWSEDPTCESGAAADTDGDGLLDYWETTGLTVSVGGTEEFVDLPAMGADRDHKDLFVEVDWMGAGSANDGSHRPQAAAIQRIVDSFDAAPVSNPDGTTGIHLHVDYGPTSPLTWGSGGTWGTLSHGEEIAHQTYVSTCAGNNFQWNGVDTIKAGHLSPGRAAVFHYNIWAHSLCSSNAGTSGISRNQGGADFGSGASDFIVSLGGWSTNPGTADEQAGTFMHELGHNLGLRHGGDNHDLWKPNYLSIMNYAFQTRGLLINNTEAHFDYSRYDAPDLDENNLNETTGIRVTTAATNVLGTRYFCAVDDMRVDTDARAVDWNCDGDETDTSVSRNINQGMSWNNNSTRTVLTSWNDWDHIVFTGGAIGQPGTTVDLPSEAEVIDVTEEQDRTIRDFITRTYLPLLRR